HPGWAATEPGGRVPVAESVAGMRGVMHRAGPHHTGSFVSYHAQPLPWSSKASLAGTRGGRGLGAVGKPERLLQRKILRSEVKPDRHARGSSLARLIRAALNIVRRIVRQFKGTVA